MTPHGKPERLNIAQVILFFVMGVPAFAAVFYWIIVYGGLRGIPE